MDFVYWLEALPAATVGKLYGSQWACQAVLRSLPPLAKQYVARMLFVETPIPSSKPTSSPLSVKGSKKESQYQILLSPHVMQGSFSYGPLLQQQARILQP